MFQLVSLNDSTPANPDFITDFSRADGDQIVISFLDADPNTAGRQPYDFLGQISPNNFAATGTGQFGYYSDGFNTFVQLDNGSGGGAEAVIKLSGVIALEINDFTR